MHCKRRGSEKSPFLAIFWVFLFSQDRLFSRNSTRNPLNLIKSPIFTNTPCKSTCLYNAPSMHTVEPVPLPDKNLCDSLVCNSQKFPKGVGGQRGLAQGSPSHTTDSGLFSAPFSFFPLCMSRRTQFWGTFLLHIGCSWSPTPSRQPLFETSEIVSALVVVRRGCKGLPGLGSEKRFVLVQNGFAPVHNRLRMVQRTLGRLLLSGPKRPFATSPNHFCKFCSFRTLSQKLSVHTPHLSASFLAILSCCDLYQVLCDQCAAKPIAN